jgi:hypothetical protein
VGEAAQAALNQEKKRGPIAASFAEAFSSP